MSDSQSEPKTETKEEVRPRSILRPTPSRTPSRPQASTGLSEARTPRGVRTPGRTPARPQAPAGPSGAQTPGRNPPAARKKRARGDKGIQHPTSIARILKSGTGIEKVRCSIGAARNTSDLVDEYLKRLGECSSQLLQLTKTKTVTKEILAQCVKTGGVCYYHGAEDILRFAKTSGDGRSKKRDNIGPFTSKRAFEKGIALGKGANRVSEGAKWGLAALAEGYVLCLGKNASPFIKVSKRKTILVDDIKYALEAMRMQ